MHDDTNSFLLFNVHRSGSQIMTNFSLKHKLQRLVELLYGLARQTICHVREEILSTRGQVFSSGPHPEQDFQPEYYLKSVIAVWFSAANNLPCNFMLYVVIF